MEARYADATLPSKTLHEAVTRLTMRFVPIKSSEEQVAGMVQTGELIFRQRCQTANAMRAHLAELGIVAAADMTSIAKLIADLRDGNDARLSSAARMALLEMAEQIEMLTAAPVPTYASGPPAVFQRQANHAEVDQRCRDKRNFVRDLQSRIVPFTEGAQV